MKRFLQGVVSGGVFLLSVFFLVMPLSAQASPNGLTVSPAFQEVVLDQKDIQKDFFVSLSNTSQGTVILRVAKYDFGTLDESGGVAFLGASNDLEKKYALASWMYPEKDILTLGPGETQKILVTVENSDTLGPGGHYGALTFSVEDASQGALGREGISVNQLFSTLVFVKKIGGERYQLELKSVDYQSSLFRLQKRTQLHFLNGGNVHLVPRGTVVVLDPFQRMIARGIINEQSTLILPESSRVYSLSLETIARSFVPGWYTMEISYRYDGKDDFVKTSLRFISIPPVAMVGLLSLMVIFGWYGVKRRRRISKKHVAV